MEEFQKYFSQTTFLHHVQARNAKISIIFHFDRLTMVGFVIFCVLILGATYNLQQCLSHQKVRAEIPILNGIYFEKNIHRWCQEMVVLPAKNSFLAQLSIFMVRKENTLLFLTFDLGSWLAGMYLVKCQPLCKSVWHIGTYI